MKVGTKLFGVLALCVISLLALGQQPAAADTTLCPPGSGAGQCSDPRGVATDFETGNVFVVDRANQRINVFKASNQEFLFAFGWGVDTGAAALEKCTTASGCQAGISGAGAGQFSSPVRIAVDNVVGSATRHDVYVGTDNLRIQHFKADGSFVNAFGWGVDTGASALEVCTTASGCQAGISGNGACQLSDAITPIAVGPGGVVGASRSFQTGTEPSGAGIFENKLEQFSAAGACAGGVSFTPTITRRSRALAIDASGAIYISFSVVHGIRKYSAAGSEQCAADAGTETNSMALGETGNLLASQRENPEKAAGTFQVITEYGSTCNQLRRFGYGKIGANLLGLAAFSSAAGDVLGSEESGAINYLSFPPPGPLVANTEVLSTGNTSAKVRAEVNPEGKATQVKVEYVDDAEFDADVLGGGNGFEGAGTKSQTKELLPASGEEFSVKAVEFLLGCESATKQLIEEGKCISPETEYHWRVTATNADGGGEGPKAGPNFTTKESLEMEVFASGVATDTAILSALVNPLGVPASGYFEYVDDANYQASGFTNAVKVPNPAAIPPQAEIDFGGGEAEVKRSVTLYPLAEGTTYHYRLSATDALIDVHLPSEEKTFTTFKKVPPEACAANEAFRGGASGLLPDCRAFELVSPLDKANGDIVVLPEGFTALPATLNQSAVSGTRLAYGSYRSFGDALSSPYTSQYLAARGEGGWASHGINPAADHSIKGSLEFDNEFRFFSDDLCEAWLVPLFEPPLAAGAEAGHLNVYRRTDQLCGGSPDYELVSPGKPANLKRPYRVELQGLSGDGSVAAFAARDSLEGSGAPAQPAGCAEATATNCNIQAYVRAAGGPARYACVLPGGAALGGPCSAGTSGPVLGQMRTGNMTGALSGDGKRLYWTAGNEAGKLYLRENPTGAGTECAGAAPCTFAVSEATNSHFWAAAAADGSKAIFSAGATLSEYDAAAKTTQKIADGFLGFMGASKDVGHVYFASSEAIAGSGQNSEGASPVAGKANLYLHIAGAGSGSYRFVGTLAAADVKEIPTRETSSATALWPGRHDGRVSASGLHAAFMSAAPLTGYDNTDAASGAPDTEVFVYDAEAGGGAGEILCASCNPSGGRPTGTNVSSGVLNPFWVSGRIPTFETTLYAPRVLAEDGSRLYFESQDALLPRDTNSRLDVYQWERAGKGGCKTTGATYSPAAGGCIDLISSGQSRRDSAFLDASPTGNDVFFTTLSSLLPEDYGLVDIYDARIGGGFPTPPPPTPECEGETCQNPPPAPEFQPPGSSAVGPGNLPPEEAKKPKKCPKGKHPVKQGGKTKCVKNKKGKGKAKKSGGARR